MEWMFGDKFVSRNVADEAWMALSEHRAYNECVQFEGDTCDTCEALEAEAVAASAATSMLDCDGCGELVPLYRHPSDLVIVLCRNCNGGTEVS